MVMHTIIPIQKSKLTRRRAADSTTSTARRDNEVRLFFWIGITLCLNKANRTYVGFQTAYLGSVHISSVRKILSAKVRLQGEKRSKVGHLASIFNAAGAFLSQNIAA